MKNVDFPADGNDMLRESPLLFLQALNYATFSVYLSLFDRLPYLSVYKPHPHFETLKWVLRYKGCVGRTLSVCPVLDEVIIQNPLPI